MKFEHFQIFLKYNYEKTIISSNPRLSAKLKELKKIKEKFTNVEAHQISAESHFNVDGNIPIAKVILPLYPLPFFAFFFASCFFLEIYFMPFLPCS